MDEEKEKTEEAVAFSAFENRNDRSTISDMNNPSFHPENSFKKPQLIRPDVSSDDELPESKELDEEQARLSSISTLPPPPALKSLKDDLVFHSGEDEELAAVYAPFLSDSKLSKSPVTGTDHRRPSPKGESLFGERETGSSLELNSQEISHLSNREQDLLMPSASTQTILDLLEVPLSAPASPVDIGADEELNLLKLPLPAPASPVDIGADEELTEVEPFAALLAEPELDIEMRPSPLQALAPLTSPAPEVPSQAPPAQKRPISSPSQDLSPPPRKRNIFEPTVVVKPQVSKSMSTKRLLAYAFIGLALWTALCVAVQRIMRL